MKGSVLMKDKFFLVSIYEGDLDGIRVFNSPEDAREVMAKAVIEALDGVDESIFESYQMYSDYECVPDKDDAWVHIGKQRSWRIISGKEIIGA